MNTTKVDPREAVAGPFERPVRPLDLDAIRFLASGQDDPQSMALRECAAELWALRRWKSTNAPRLEALEGLLHTAQQEAHAGREAIATLASERSANALLTGEVDRLRVTLANESRRVCGDEKDCVLQPHCSHAQKCMRPEWEAKA